MLLANEKISSAGLCKLVLYDAKTMTLPCPINGAVREEISFGDEFEIAYDKNEVEPLIERVFDSGVGFSRFSLPVFIEQDNLIAALNANRLVYGDWIAIVKDLNGNERVIGTNDCPAKMRFLKSSSGSVESKKAGTFFELVWAGPGKIPFYVTD